MLKRALTLFGLALAQTWCSVEAECRPLEDSRYDRRGPNPTGRAQARFGGAERSRTAASQFCRLLP
jgi:hypothetical protein